jgi:hypothetical protein
MAYPITQYRTRSKRARLGRAGRAGRRGAGCRVWTPAAQARLIHHALRQLGVNLHLALHQGHMPHYADSDEIVCGIDAMAALPRPPFKEHVLSRA